MIFNRLNLHQEHTDLLCRMSCSTLGSPLYKLGSCPSTKRVPLPHPVYYPHQMTTYWYKLLRELCQSISCWTQLRSPTFGNQESMLIRMAINFESWLRWSRRIHGISTTTCLCTNSRGTLPPRRKASDGQWPTCTCCMLTSTAAHCASNRLLRWMRCTWMPLSWCTMRRATKWSPFLSQIWLPTKPPTGIEDGALQSYVGLLREVLVRCQRRLMKLKLIQKGRHPCLLKSLFLFSKKSSSSLIEVTWMLCWNFRKGSLVSLGSKGLCFFLWFLMPACNFWVSIAWILRWVHYKKSFERVAEVFHEKAQKNEILKLEKLSRAEAEVRGLSEVWLAGPWPASLMQQCYSERLLVMRC